MSDRCFIDTNVFIYAFSKTEIKKQKQAKLVIDTNDCYTSTHALGEYSNVSIKKLHLTAEQISKDINDIIGKCALAEISLETVQHALDLHERYKYSYFDSLMLASALECECNIIYSEDMKDGQIIDKSLIIRNPFL
jgi:predicted nucleic acid-binding protein